MNRKRFFPAVAILLCVAILGAGNVTPFAETMVYAAAASSDSHGDDEHGAPASDPLSFDSLKRDLALWSLIIFLILFAILAKFAFGPIAQALDAREKAVADQIESATQANEEAKNLLEQYKQKLADSKDEVRQILETARADAQRSADGIVAKAKEAASQENARALKDIESATATALQNIAEKSATLATELAGKMIRKEVTQENHRDLIRGALDEFAKN